MSRSKSIFFMLCLHNKKTVKKISRVMVEKDKKTSCKQLFKNLIFSLPMYLYLSNFDFCKN